MTTTTAARSTFAIDVVPEALTASLCAKRAAAAIALAEAAHQTDVRDGQLKIADRWLALFAALASPTLIRS